MKLKLMATVNFQRTEAENFLAVMKANPHVVLSTNDVVLMVSMAKDQMVFMHPRKEIDVSKYGHRRGMAHLYHSERVRLDRSSFDWRMLQEYAEEAGLVLDGFKKLAEQYPKLRDESNIVNVPIRRKTKLGAKPGKVVALRKVA